MPALAQALSQAGYQVVTDGAPREAATTIRGALERNGAFPVLVSDTPWPGLRTWTKRTAQATTVVVLHGPDGVGTVFEGVISIPLPAPLVEIASQCGFSLPPEAADLQVMLDGSVVDSQTAAAEPLASSIVEMVPVAGQAASAAVVHDVVAIEVADPEPSATQVSAAPMPATSSVVTTPQAEASPPRDPWAEQEAMYAAQSAAEEHQPTLDPPFPAPSPAPRAPVHEQPAFADPAFAVPSPTPVAPAPVVEPEVTHEAPAFTAPAFTAPVFTAPAVPVDEPEITHEAPAFTAPVFTAPAVQQPPAPVVPAPVDEPVAHEAPVFTAPVFTAPAVPVDEPEITHEAPAFTAPVFTAPAVQQPPAPVVPAPVDEPEVAHEAPASDVPVFAAPAVAPASVLTPSDAPMPFPGQPVVEQPLMTQPQATPGTLVRTDEPQVFNGISLAPVTGDGHAEVVVVYAGKGGVGKTSTSIGLAEAASSAGLRVILIDGNMGQGDIRIFLRIGMAALPSIYNYAVAGDLRQTLIDPATLNDARDVKQDPLRFALIQAPPPHLTDPSVVTPEVYLRLVQEARQHCDLVIVDTQIIEPRAKEDPMVTGFVNPLLRAGAWSVGISDLSTPGISNLRSRLKKTTAMQVPVERRMTMMNRVDPSTPFNADGLASALGEHSLYLGVVYDDAEISESMNQGRSPGSFPAISAMLNAILGTVQPEWAPALEARRASAPKAKAPAKRGLFGRRRR
ncbi:hypothetical protein ASF47_18565 [Nocardioides sp. Leaf285]|nr:hypothetical protein ASF47_18565 [Nocardioides sp. Leaf285]